MFITKCPHCKSSKIKKNGHHKGAQLYKCNDCGHQFLRGSLKPSTESIWSEYLDGKQTIVEIAERHCLSESTIKRILRKRDDIWTQPDLAGMSGFIHLDATYWGRNWGIMLGLDEATGKTIYLAFIRHETDQSYIDAIAAVEKAGYKVKGIIIDGKMTLFEIFKDYPIQMCQFHMIQIVKRYLTQHPKMKASRELLHLCQGMTEQAEEDFRADYVAWKTRWKDFLSKRSVHKDGKTYYLHRRVRTVMNSLDFYLTYLFTFQRPECEGMPNTNNKIEGTFTDLKKNLNNHSGLTLDHRQQFISAYFLARAKAQPINI